MPRLFTGVEIPPDVGQALSTLRGGLPGARWIDPENYHLTLRFIGDVDDNIAHEVASMLGRVKRGAFELYMEGLTSFGGRKPRAVVASVVPAQALLDVQAEHERRCSASGSSRKAANSRHMLRWRACVNRPASRSPNIFRPAAIFVRRPSGSHASCCSRRGRPSEVGRT